MPRPSVDKNARKEMEAIVTAHNALAGLNREQQERALSWILHRLGVGSVGSLPPPGPWGAEGGRAGKRGARRGGGAAGAEAPVDVSGLRELFARRKPETEVERILCLARHATTTAKMSTFGTRDLTRMNAAGNLGEFTNASVAMSSALQRGLFVTAGSGQYRITDLGNQFVDALPDHDRARQIARGTRRRPGRPPGSKNAKSRKGGRGRGRPGRKAKGAAAAPAASF